jgi:glutaredoxin
MNRLIAAALLLAFAAPLAFADLYSWTDAKGVKHFSNEPPPEGEKVFDLIVVKETVEPEPEPAAEAPVSGARAAADTTAPAGAAKKIDVYIEPKSAACKQAMAFFNQNQVRYSVHDISVSAQARQQYEALEGKTVPLVIINGERLDGWDEARARALLARP